MCLLILHTVILSGKSVWIVLILREVSASEKEICRNPRIFIISKHMPFETALYELNIIISRPAFWMSRWQSEWTKCAWWTCAGCSDKYQILFFVSCRQWAAALGRNSKCIKVIRFSPLYYHRLTANLTAATRRPIPNWPSNLIERVCELRMICL